MAQDSSNKLITLGNLTAFKQKLDTIYSTQQSVDYTLNQFREDFTGNLNNTLNCSSLELSGNGTLSIATVTPQSGSSYCVLRITCGNNITEIPISADNTVATANDVLNKADKVTIEYNNSSYSFLTTPCIGTFYTKYTVSSNGTTTDTTESGQQTAGNLNAGSGTSMLGKIVFIEVLGNVGHGITGYISPGFYLVTTVRGSIISAATYICPAYENGLYFSIGGDKFFRKSSNNGSLVEIRISSTTVVNGNLSYGIASEGDIDDLFDIIDGGENNG